MTGGMFDGLGKLMAFYALCILLTGVMLGFLIGCLL